MSQRLPMQTYSLLCMLGLQDKLMGHSTGLSFKSGTSQVPSLQILKSCRNRITILQVMACGECSTSFFNASAANLLAKLPGMMILEPLVKTACMVFSLHVYYSSAVSMYPSSARGVAGQNASSSGEEQLPYHNLDEKEGNLFST